MTNQDKIQYLKELRTLSEQLGRPPLKREYPHAKEIIKLCKDSWKSALTEAGCYESHINPYSDEKLYEKYLSLRTQLGRKPTSIEFSPYYQIIYRRYGSWKSWLKAMGEPTENRDSDEALIKILQEFYEKNGRSPSAKEISRSHVIRKNLGNGRWSEALKRAGLPAAKVRRHTDKELIEKIQEKAKELGRPPIAREMPESATILRHFGSWKQGLMNAGVVPAKRSYDRQKKIENKELLLDIQVFILQHGRAPYYREYEHSGLCVKRYGRWSEAVAQAQADPYDTMDKARSLALSSNI